MKSNQQKSNNKKKAILEIIGEFRDEDEMNEIQDAFEEYQNDKDGIDILSIIFTDRDFGKGKLVSNYPNFTLNLEMKL